MAESVWQRLTRGARRLIAAPDWERFAGPDWAEKILTTPVTDRFFAKQGRSIGRWILRSGPDRLVVYLKRHYELPRWRGWLAALWPGGDWSPALSEYRHLESARSLGVPVPRVAAAGEFLAPGGRLQSFLAVEELTGMLPLHEAVPLAQQRQSPADFTRWKHGLTAELARLCLLLHGRSWYHKDLYFCHFYVPEADTFRAPPAWEGRVHLIDFHRLARHPWAAPWWQAKDLGQLLYSSDVPGVSARDRLRFWKLYAAGPSGPLRGVVRRIAEMRARTNHRHNQRRPQVPRAA